MTWQSSGLQCHVCDPVAFPSCSVLPFHMYLSLSTGRVPAVAVAPRRQMPTPSIATHVPGEIAKWASPPAAHPQDPCPQPRSPARPPEPLQSPRAVELPPSWGRTPLSRPTTAARPFSSPLTPRNVLLRLELSTPSLGLPTPQALQLSVLLGPQAPRVLWLPPVLLIPQAQAHQARSIQLLPPPPVPLLPPLPLSGRNQP